MEYMALEIWINIRAQVISIRADEHDFQCCIPTDLERRSVTLLDDKRMEATGNVLPLLCSSPVSLHSK